jgi:hypothetical protein
MMNPPPPTGTTAPRMPGPHYQGLTVTLSRPPLDESSAQCRDLYLTTHKTHKRQTSCLQRDTNATITASAQRQIYTLDRVATAGYDEILSTSLKLCDR